MAVSPQPHFRIDWVLVNQLAVGPAPRTAQHLKQLADAGVRAVLSLCSHEEAPLPEGLNTRFACERIVLPDHRSGRPPQLEELRHAMGLVQQLHQAHGPVFVHCVAAMERSPLVCLGWLVQQHQLNPTEALDYIMQVHPGTNPLPAQLALLKELV